MAASVLTEAPCRQRESSDTRIGTPDDEKSFLFVLMFKTLCCLCFRLGLHVKKVDRLTPGPHGVFTLREGRFHGTSSTLLSPFLSLLPFSLYTSCKTGDPVEGRGTSSLKRTRGFTYSWVQLLRTVRKFCSRFTESTVLVRS